MLFRSVRNDSYYDCYLNALSNHKYDIIKLLVDNNYKVNNDVIKQSAMTFRSDTKNDYRILDLLVKNNTEEKDNSLLLNVYWSLDCLKILLDNGYDPNTNYCLHFAVKDNYYDSCKLLLEYGASPDSKMKNDEPICYPVKDDNIKMVKLLMEYNIIIYHPYILLRICKSDEMKRLIKDYTGYDEKTNEGIKKIFKLKMIKKYNNFITEKKTIDHPYDNVFDKVKNSKKLSKDMKEQILPLIITSGIHGTTYDKGRVFRLKIPHVDGKSFDGVDLGADKNGFFVFTHRARCKSKPTIDKISKKSIEFIKSTG